MIYWCLPRDIARENVLFNFIVKLECRGKLCLQYYQPGDGDPPSQRRQHLQHLQRKGPDRYVKEYLRRMRLGGQSV